MYNKESHELLIAAAKTHDEFVSYSEIITVAKLDYLTGDALSGELGRLFHDIIKQDIAIDPERPMLSAVSISSTTMQPSKGFFALARDMGKLSSKEEKDELKFWLEELKRLRNYWQNQPS